MDDSGTPWNKDNDTIWPGIWLCFIIAPYLLQLGQQPVFLQLGKQAHNKFGARLF